MTGPAFLTRKARQGAGPSHFSATGARMGRGALQRPRSPASTAGPSTAVVKPCSRREAAASRAPSVESGDGLGAVEVSVGVTVRVLIPLGAVPHPQIKARCKDRGWRRGSSSSKPRRSEDFPAFRRSVIAVAPP